MEYWYKQTDTEPLFKELEWDKPERKDLAGKLLIIGGNLHGFSSVAKAFEYARDEGIGYERVIVPDALKKTLYGFWTDAMFGESTTSGSFSVKANDLILQNMLWADGVLLPGDLGRNSETAILLDTLLRSSILPITITRDALDYYLTRAELLFSRPETYIVASFSQLQKLLSSTTTKYALTYDMPLQLLVSIVADVTSRYPVGLVTKRDGVYVSACNGKVSTSRFSESPEIWRVKLASHASVSLLHHPNKQLEVLTNSLRKLILPS